MKKLLLVSLATLALSLTSSAATITWNCATTGAVQGLSGQSGSNTVTTACTTIDLAAPLGSIFTNVTMNFVLDFTFNNFDPGAKSTTWAVNALGTNLDVAGFVVDNSGGANQRPHAGSTSTSNAADLALYSALGTGPINFAAGTISYTGASTAVTGGTADMQIILTYTSSVPEPSTFALLGSALVGIGMIAHRKR